MIRWATPPSPRCQASLIPETLDELVRPDHPIRQIDAILNEVDWRPWEAEYERLRGQPPIHPRYVAGAILYGVIKRIRSSRGLEEATKERLDFRWFLEGQTIDHASFAAFRIKFEAQLKNLVGQFGRAAVERTAGEGELVSQIIDGTRIRANSDWRKTRSAKGLAKTVHACTEALKAKMKALEAEDKREEADAQPVEALRQEVTRLRKDRAKHYLALRQARQRDRVRQAKDGEKATPIRVSVTDPDATLLPNKEGGYAPNYTPIAAVDEKSGVILYADVVAGSDESGAVQPAVEQCRALLGKPPARLLADSRFASGENLKRLEAEKIVAYMPTGTDPRPENPANRPDPTVAVPGEQWDQLPKKKNRLHANAFVYDKEHDCYHCPAGKSLEREGGECRRENGTGYWRYSCPGKEGCPLADRCAGAKADRRTVTRDQYQDLRDQTGLRLATEEGKAIYARRSPAGEGVFGIIKSSFGVRQFLLRGMKKVRMEWNWVCGAFNLKKLVGLETARLAAKGGEA